MNAAMAIKGGERRWLDLNWPDQATFDQWPDQAVLDRILVAVQERIPTNLDKAQLLAALKDATHLYIAGMLMRQQPAKQRQRGNKVIATARRLKLLLDDGQNPPVTHQSPSLYCQALDLLIGDVERLQQLAAQYGSNLGLGERSAFEQLCMQLQKMFETHFGIKHRYTKAPDSCEIEGPVIDFIEATLKELGALNSGKPYSRRAIADALGRRRLTGKSARK